MEGFEGILHVLEDSSVDELEKWRQFCYKQLVLIKVAELEHKSDQQKTLATIQELDDSIKNLQNEVAVKGGEEKRDIAKEEWLQKKMKELEQQLNESKELAAKAAVIRCTVNSASTKFRIKHEAFKYSSEPIINELYQRMTKGIDDINKRIERIQNKIPEVRKVISKRRVDEKERKMLEERLQLKCDRLRNEINAIPTIEMPSDVPPIEKTTRQLRAIKAEIEEIRQKQNAIQLREIQSEAPVLRQLIQNQEMEYRNRIKSIEDHYDTTDIDSEIAELKSKLPAIESDLMAMQEAHAKTKTELEDSFNARKKALREKRSSNAAELEVLRAKVEELRVCVPPPKRQTLSSKGIQVDRLYVF